jgi:hypothetical protein
MAPDTVCSSIWILGRIAIPTYQPRGRDAWTGGAATEDAGPGGTATSGTATDGTAFGDTGRGGPEPGGPEPGGTGPEGSGPEGGRSPGVGAASAEVGGAGTTMEGVVGKRNPWL